MLNLAARLAPGLLTAPVDIALGLVQRADNDGGYVSTTAPAFFPPDHRSAPPGAARAWPEGYRP